MAGFLIGLWSADLQNDSTYKQSWKLRSAQPELQRLRSESESLDLGRGRVKPDSSNYLYPYQDTHRPAVTPRVSLPWTDYIQPAGLVSTLCNPKVFNFPVERYGRLITFHLLTQSRSIADAFYDLFHTI